MLQMWFKQDASDLLGYFRDKRGAPRVGLANGIEKRFRQAGGIGLRRVLKGDELICFLKEMSRS